MTEKMTWKKIVLLAVVSGVLTGLINCVDILQETSFTVPAVTPELWLVLALWIVLKCEAVKEAMMKTFVFFLISQPLVYLVEVPFKADGWGLFRYYPFWGMMTVLTIPCAYLAFQIRKRNPFSTLVVSGGTAFLAYSMIYYGDAMMASFPRYLLHEIFCAVCIGVMIVKLIPGKKERVISLILTIAAALLLAKMTIYKNQKLQGEIQLDPAHTWQLVEERKGVDVVDEGEGRFVYSTRVRGNDLLEFVNEDGEVVTIEITMTDQETYAEIFEW